MLLLSSVFLLCFCTTVATWQLKVFYSILGQGEVEPPSLYCANICLGMEVNSFTSLLKITHCFWNVNQQRHLQTNNEAPAHVRFTPNRQTTLERYCILSRLHLLLFLQIFHGTSIIEGHFRIVPDSILLICFGWLSCWNAHGQQLTPSFLTLCRTFHFRMNFIVPQDTLQWSSPTTQLNCSFLCTVCFNFSFLSIFCLRSKEQFPQSFVAVNEHVREFHPSLWWFAVRTTDGVTWYLMSSPLQ